MTFMLNILTFFFLIYRNYVLPFFWEHLFKLCLEFLQIINTTHSGKYCRNFFFFLYYNRWHSFFLLKI